MVGAGDEAAVRRLADVRNEIRRHDTPWLPQLTVAQAAGELVAGWDDHPGVFWLATEGGEVVGWCHYHVSDFDNRHLAWCHVEVAPGHRRRGHGSRMLESLIEQARSEGRRTIGFQGWANALPLEFMQRHGFSVASVDVARRQTLAEVDRARLDALRAEALAAAADYEVVVLDPPTPPSLAAEVAAMASAINDAPTDDLDMEDERFTAERLDLYERNQETRGLRLRRVVARHRETGALAGQSVVGVPVECPTWGDHHDTSVVGEHRGHRLGLLLKIAMLDHLRETEPQLAVIDTWNAATNDRMIAVNEALGYRVLGQALACQLRLAEVS